MSKAKSTFTSTLIVVGAMAGAVAITQQLTPGFQSLFPSSANPSSSSSSSTDQTVQGDPVNYQYGTVQVEVVSTGGKITAINLLKSDATNGRQNEFPPLVQAALAAQGANFGNVSGSTYTAAAFKQALTSAISKLK